jgi:hypothetical protein
VRKEAENCDCLQGIIHVLHYIFIWFLKFSNSY